MNQYIKRFRAYIQNASWYMGASLFVAFIGIVLNPLYASNLSHADYAIIGYYSSFNLFLYPILHFCLFSYYSRQYYFTPEEKRERLGDTVLLASMLLGLGSLILFTCFFYVFHQVSHVEFDFYPYAVLTFVEVYVLNISTFYKTKLKIRRKARPFAVFSIVACLITTILTLLLVVYYKYGAVGKLWAALIASSIVAVYSIAHSLNKWEIDRQILKKGLKFTWPLVLGSFLWYFISGIDKSFLEKIHDVHTYGSYCVGLSIASYMSIFFNTISSTFLPDLYQSIAEKRHKKLFGICFMIVGSTAIFNFLFIIFAPLLIDLLTAGRYAAAYPFARIFAVYNILFAVFSIIENIVIGYGFTKQTLYVKVLGAGLAVGIYYLMIKFWSFSGGAWGQCVVMISLSFLLMLSFFYKIRASRNINL